MDFIYNGRCDRLKSYMAKCEVEESQQGDESADGQQAQPDLGFHGIGFSDERGKLSSAFMDASRLKILRTRPPSLHFGLSCCLSIPSRPSKCSAQKGKGDTQRAFKYICIVNTVRTK